MIFVKKVGIIMGSDSDLPVVEKAISTLKEYGVPFEVHVFSAHRTPEQSKAFSQSAIYNGFGAIIAAAGKAAHLAGAVAANTTLPVIGIPVKASTLDGLDALLSTVQMPTGIPVATVAIDGAKNAVSTLSARTTPYVATLSAATVSSIIACNQTLTIMLTHQLCNHIEKSDESKAIHLEDTAVLIPALVPWSTAAAVPIASVGCSAVCIVFAFFPYIQPLWILAVELIKKRKK